MNNPGPIIMLVLCVYQLLLVVLGGWIVLHYQQHGLGGFNPLPWFGRVFRAAQKAREKDIQ